MRNSFSSLKHQLSSRHHTVGLKMNYPTRTKTEITVLFIKQKLVKFNASHTEAARNLIFSQNSEFIM